MFKFQCIYKKGPENCRVIVKYDSEEYSNVYFSLYLPRKVALSYMYNDTIKGNYTLKQAIEEAEYRYRIIDKKVREARMNHTTPV